MNRRFGFRICWREALVVAVLVAWLPADHATANDGPPAAEPSGSDSPSSTQGKGKGKGKGKGASRSESSPEAPEPPSAESADLAGGILTTITAIDGDRVTFAEAGSSSSGGKGGKGGKGRSSRGGSTTTLPVAPTLVVSTGTIASRTQEFQPGGELGGGLENAHFDAVRNGDSVRVRIVVDADGEQITEINVIVADATMEDSIAVRPKRPPMKTLTQP